MQWREVEGLESPPKDPPWLQQPWTGEQKAGTASPPAPAWPGTGLRSLSGPSPQAAVRRVPAPEPSSPARRAPAGRAPRGRLSVLLHSRCCAAGVGDRGRAGGLQHPGPWHRERPPAPSLPWSTEHHEAPSCWVPVGDTTSRTSNRCPEVLAVGPAVHQASKPAPNLPEHRQRQEPTAPTDAGTRSPRVPRARRGAGSTGLAPVKSSPGLGPAPGPTAAGWGRGVRGPSSKS